MESVVKSFLVVLLLTAIQLSYAKQEHSYYKEPEPVCKFEVDFSTPETSLRSAIFLANAEKAASILNKDDCFGLARGLTYEDEQLCLLTISPGKERRNDPDIVAVRALALNAEYGGDVDRLATIIVLSYELTCQCSVLTTLEKDDIKAGWKEVLSDPKMRQFIINFPGEHESEEKEDDGPQVIFSVKSNYRGLLVTESSPTNSFTCAYCDPRATCQAARVRWCL